MIKIFSSFTNNNDFLTIKPKQQSKNYFVHHQVDSVSFSGRVLLPSTIVATDYIEKLKTSLVKSSIPFDETPVSPAAFARKIIQETGLNVSADKLVSFDFIVRKLLMNAGFKIIDKKTAAQAAKETPASAAIRKYIKELLAEYKANNMEFEKHPVSPTVIAKRIKQRTGLEVIVPTVNKALKGAGFRIIDIKTANETPASKVIRGYLEKLEADYIATNMKFEEHPVNPTEIVKNIQQETDVKITHNAVKGQLKYTRFKTRDASAAMQALHGTPSSAAVKKYVEELVSKYKELDLEIGEHPISLAKHVKKAQQLIGDKIATMTMYRALKNAGFEIMCRGVSRKTPSSVAIKKYIEKLEENYKAEGHIFTEHPVSAYKLARKIEQETGLKINTAYLLKKLQNAGFKTLDLLSSKETPSSLAVKKAIQELLAHYKANNMKFEEHPVSASKLAKKIEQETGLEIYFTTVVKKLRNAGFKTASQKTANEALTSQNSI